MAADLEQDTWKTELKNRFPQYFSGIKVLDIGSADMNGNNRPWFDDCEYIGLDIAEYKNVDVVAIAHEYDAPDGSFDVIISTNHLEHDIYWEKTLKKMVQLLKNGGLMVFQTTHERPEHGTKNANPDDSLTVKSGNEEWANFFKHYTIEEIKEILKPDEVFSQYEISYQPEDKRDVYFWGIKRDKIRLDIGSGLKTDWIEGDWIRVDPYAEDARVKAFAHDLPYKDGEADEVWSSHTLEHMGKFEVVPVLKEWHRVLKEGGKLTIRVPDLEWCCNWWINHQTTGWDMDVLFGNQSREGEFHKTGFNREIMVDYLREAGFKVDKFEEVETHNQKTLHFECIK